MEIKHTYLECLLQLKAKGITEIEVPYLISKLILQIDTAIHLAEESKDPARNYIVIGNTIYQAQALAKAVA